MEKSTPKPPQRSTGGSARSFVRIVAFLAVALITAGPRLQAADTWDGGAGDDNWNSGLNWVGNLAPANDGTASIIFSGTTRLTPNVDTNWNVFSLTIDATSGAFTLGGNPLTIQTNGIVNNDANTQTINNNITLGAAQTWNASSGNLVFGGSITNGGLTLTIDGANDTTLGNVISGTGGLTKDGAGTLTLSGTTANTFSGETYLNAGTLVLNKTAGVDAIIEKIYVGDGLGGANADVLLWQADDQIVDNKEVHIRSSGQIDLNGFDDTLKLKTMDGGSVTTGTGTLTLDNHVELLATAPATATIAGNINLGANRDFDVNDAVADDDLVISAIISGAYELTKKNNTGRLVLTGDNTYTGLTTVEGGPMRIEHDNALGTVAGGTTVKAGGALEIQGGLNIGAEALTLNGTGVAGAGALRNLSGSNTWAGNVLLGTDSTIASDDGIFMLNGNLDANSDLTAAGDGDITINGIISNKGILTKVGAGTLTLTSSNTYAGATVLNGGVTIIKNDTSFGTTAGGVTVASNATLHLDGGSGIAVGAEALTLNATGIGNDGVLRNISGDNSWAGDVTLNTDSLLAIDAGSLILGGDIGGNGALTKIGTGPLTLSGDSTYLGLSTVQIGVLNIQHGAALGSTTAGTIVSNGAALQIQGNIAVGTEALTLNGSGISNDGSLRNISGNNSWSGPVTLNTHSILASDAGNLTLGGIVSGGYDLTKVGGGTLTLSGNNTYTGQTTVKAGALNLQHDNALGTTAAGTVISNGAALQIQGNISVGAEELTLNGTGVASDGALRNVSGNNSWSGDITQTSASTLASDAGTFTLSGSLINGGHLTTFTGAGNGNITGVISGSGGLTKSGAGTLTLTGVNTFSGNSTIDGGVIVIDNDQSLGDTDANLTINNGTLQVTNGFSSARDIVLGHANSTIQVDPAQNHTISSVINGSGGLTKTGSGTLTLNGVNTFTGDSTIHTGTVAINNANSLGDSSASLTLNGAAVQATDNISSARATTLGTATSTIGVNAGKTYTLTSVIDGSGQLNKTGAGTLSLSGANTYAGITVVSNGVLNIQNATALGSTAAGTIVSNGAALQIQGGIAIGAEELTLNGSGISSDGALRNISGNNSYAGDITLGSISTLGSDAGTLAISGNLTNSAYGISFAGAGNITLSGMINGTGNLTNNMTGTLTLAGTDASTMSGETYLNSGTLALNKTAGVDAIIEKIYVGDGLGGANADVLLWLADDQIVDNKEVHIRSSGQIDLNGFDDTLKLKTMDGGSVTTGSGTLTLDNHVELLATAPATATIAGNLNLGANRDFDVNDAVADDDLVISAIISGAYQLNKKNNTGRLVLTGDNTYTGLTTVEGGPMRIEHDNALGTIAGGTTVQAGGALEIQGGLDIGAEALTLNGTGVAGAGALRNLSGSNTWAGNVLLGNPSTIASDAGIFVLNGNLDAADTLTAAGAGDITINGIISNKGTLTKEGAGTLTLTSSNTYDAITTINGGIVNIQNGAALGTVSDETTVATGATLQLQGGIAVGAEDLTLNGDGVGSDGALRNISGNNSWAGTLTLGSASTIGSEADTLSISGNVENGGFNTIVTGPSDTTLSGVISGTGALTKNGTGTLTLSGNNTFTGDLTANAGTLLLGAADRIANTVDMTLNGASFNTGGYNESLATLTLTASSFIDFGASASVLHFADSSAVSWTGGTSITITNWSGDWLGGGTDQLYFGSTSGGLTGGQVAQIRFTDVNTGGFLPAGILASGEIVPVPEPATVVSIVLLIALVGYRERKQLGELLMMVGRWVNKVRVKPRAAKDL